MEDTPPIRRNKAGEQQSCRQTCMLLLDDGFSVSDLRLFSAGTQPLGPLLYFEDTTQRRFPAVIIIMSVAGDFKGLKATNEGRSSGGMNSRDLND